MKKDNNNILCTVSSGYSSIMMASKIKEWYPNHNVIFAMANTSKERKESLDFMNECDKHFNLNMVWIEGIINNNQKKGTNYRITTYEKLITDGSLMEAGIKKYGIPSKINKWCNRELKLVPMKKYIDKIFGVDNYSIALGIRYDEMDRLSENYKTNNIFYPLMENKIDSRLRNKFWDKQPIKIKIPAFKGNCDFCFEKSKRKILTIIKEDFDLINWWLDKEDKYSKNEIKGKPCYNAYVENGGAFFSRSNKSFLELIEEAKNPFRSATDEYIYENDMFDSEDECGNSCEIFK